MPVGSDFDPVDLSEFYRLSRPRKKPCKIGFALTQLADEDDRRKLEAALAVDKGLITSGAIVEWLTAKRQEVSVSAVGSHRKRECTCGDD